MTLSTYSFSQTRLAVPDHVLFRELDGEAVLLNLENEAYFGLDEVGTDFWVKLTGAPNLQQGVDALLAVYDVDSSELSADVERMVDELTSAGLVEVVHVSS